MKYLFDQIAEYLLPNYVKYLLCSSARSQDLFQLPSKTPALSQDQFDFNILQNSIMLSEEQITAIREYRYVLTKEHQKMSELFGKMRDIRRRIEKRQFRLQKVIDGISQTLTNEQVGKVVLWLD
jgi:hypothetical protein